jgi:SAM-dependent methyltransferase
MSNHEFTEDLHQEMGLMTSYRWANEPRGVLFMLARYKFVAQMLIGYKRVLEIGCGDGFGARLVAPFVGQLICQDIDPAMIESARANQARFGITFDARHVHNENIDAIYSLDVIEHIRPEDGHTWVAMLARTAPVVIIGTPSLESQPYASPLSRENHVNCMTQIDLRALIKEYFRHVFMFSMNDEVVHTGYSKMSHYNFAMGIN